MERILILMQAVTWVDAAPALYSARNMACQDKRLSFGLVLEEEMEQSDLLEMYALGTSRHKTGTESPWQAVEDLWQGETYILMAHPSMHFAHHWDKKLLSMLHDAGRQGQTQCVITGCPPCPEDTVDAVYPVAGKTIDLRGRLIYQCGTPLRYACHPLRSAFVNPHFCFAPSAFFRMAESAKPPLFLSAYQKRWHFYTACAPVVRMDKRLPLPCDSVRHVQEAVTASFGQRFGIDFASRKLSPMALCGIFEHDLSFPSRVPLPVRLQEALHGVKAHVSPLLPLCVTAWVQVPDIPLDDMRMVPFRRLCGMKNLPLLCFADHKSAPRITLSHPNVLEYKRRYGLKVTDEELFANLHGYVRLCKPFILAKSREKFMTHSHYIWLDFDYLRYPVYNHATLDWSRVCGDRIMLAMVNGKPDTGMIVVPQDRLEPLCHEIVALCDMSRRQNGALPTEEDVWLRLMHDHPDWFANAQQHQMGQLLSRVMLKRGEEWATRG